MCAVRKLIYTTTVHGALLFRRVCRIKKHRGPSLLKRFYVYQNTVQKFIADDDVLIAERDKIIRRLISIAAEPNKTKRMSQLNSITAHLLAVSFPFIPDDGQAEEQSHA